MIIATWNVNSIKARLPNVLAWFDELKPDVERLKRERWIGLGLLGAFSFTGGGIGSHLWKIIFGSGQ